MIVSMKAAECRGKFKCGNNKSQTIVIVDNFEEYKTLYDNIMLNDVVIYKGDIDEYIISVTPDNAKKVFLYIEVNPDIMNLDKLAKLKDYNVLCKVPEGYNDMQQLYELNKMFPNIHFCGGNLLYLDGINYGVFEVKKPVRFVMNDEYSCQQDVIALEDLEVEYEFVQPKGETIKVKAKTKKEKPVKEPKVSKKEKEEKVVKPKANKSNKYKTGGLSMF